MDKSELPRSAEKMVDAFGQFYWKEVSKVFYAITDDDGQSRIQTKEFFVTIWENSSSPAEWESKTNNFHSNFSELQDVIKDSLWEEIYFEITEPLALAFRKKKAEFAKSMATFGKMVAACGFLAGVAYSLYMYGIRF